MSDPIVGAHLARLARLSNGGLYWWHDDEGNVSQIPDGLDALRAWSRWLDTHRRVASTTVKGVWVSTVFLGIDHNFGGGGAPVLWETMIFKRRGSRALRPALGGYQARYASLADARAGHARAVAHAYAVRLATERARVPPTPAAHRHRIRAAHRARKHRRGYR